MIMYRILFNLNWFYYEYILPNLTIIENNLQFIPILFN